MNGKYTGLFFGITVLLFLLSIGNAQAALSIGSWTQNNGTTLDITTGNSPEFSYGVTAVTTYGGTYSIMLYREGTSSPIYTYVSETATVGNGAIGRINVLPSHYGNVAGKYYILINSCDKFGADTYRLDLNVANPIPPLTITCSASPTNGTSPLTVAFNAQPVGGSGTYSYQWTFGDNSIVSNTQRQMSHIYTVGTFASSVTVIDSNNRQATASCGTITVKAPIPPITGTCTITPTGGNIPLTTTLNAQISGGTGTYTYQWAYGDGTTQNSNQNSITHTYTTEGTYTANIKVIDSANNQITISCGCVTAIKPIPPITGTCTITPTSGNIPLTTTLNVQATGGTGTYNYQWTFGDGTTQNSNQNSIAHTYYTEGTYNPTIKITDSNNNQITINCGSTTAIKPIPPISITCGATPTSGTTPLSVAFNSQATGGTGTYTYKWTFGDGNIVNNNQNHLMYTYPNQGMYTTAITVTDTNGNSATANCGTINAIKPIVPITGTCTITPTGGNIPLTTTLNAQISGGTGIYNYQWTYGDGTTQNSNQNSIAHTYTTEGTYTTTLKVTDSNNNQLTITCGCITAIKPIPPISITCSANPTSGNAPLTVGFNAQANGGIGTYNYQWTFGDGNIINSYQNTQTHMYNSGTYIASVKVTDAQGKSATTSCGTINAIKPITPITGTCSATPKSGNTPLDVAFNSQISGGTGTYTYRWTFGDGTALNGNNGATHTYYTEGTYSTTLTVTDSNNNQLTINCGCITAIKPIPPISITCSANPTSGNAPLTTTLTAQATGGVGTYNYQWTFGDGYIINSYQNTQTHMYNSGTFNTNVKVTDAQGNSATTSCGTINAIKQLTGTCTVTPTNGNIPLTTSFNVQTTGGSGVYNYQWTFGDGIAQSSSQNSITHIYYTEGTYNPTIKITDSNNNQITINCGCITAIKPVTPISVTCSATPTSGNTPLNVAFNSQATGGTGIYTYKWTFGDGTTQNSNQNQILKYTYNNPGTYMTTVTVTDTQGNSATTSCGTINAIKPITPITGTCTVTPTGGNIPLTTTLNSQISGGTGTYTYKWTFGDGTTQNSNQNSILHTYYAEGTYSTTLTVTDSNNNQLTINCGCITAIKPITPISITCSANPTSGNAPLTTTLTAQATGGSGVYNYQWTFGDGNIVNSYQNVQTHLYNEGTFNTNVKVTDTQGNSATTSCGTITSIKPITPITGTCTVTPKSGDTPLTTTLNVQVAGGTGIYNYQWTFGDGNTQNSYQNSILHTYYTEGTYNPTIKITDSNNNQITICCGSVNAIKPIAPIYVTCSANPTNGNAPLTTTLTAQATGGVGTYNYQWTFGDGNIINSYQNTQTHLYNSGTFSTNVKVTDTKGNSATTSCGTINAIKPITPITGTCTVTPTNGNIPLTTTLNAQVAGGTGIYNYQWTFGDGNTQNSNQNSILHTYYTEGTYNPTIKITDSNNNQITINCGSVNAIKPLTATCSATPKSGNTPLSVAFNSQATGGTGTYTYQWKYGDGTESINSYTGNSVAHTYYTEGTYTVTLTVTDSNNNQITVCCGAITAIKPVTPISVTCNANPTSGNTPLTVGFNAQANGGIGTYNYQWTYGDGYITNSYQNTQTHQYNEGTFIASVKVTDANGNSATTSCGTINAIKPITPITGTCTITPKSGDTPLLTTLNVQANGGTGTYTYQWTYGDGNTINSYQNSITHTYYTEGRYNPKVTVIDSANNQITICCGFINVTKPVTPISITCNANPTSGNAPLTVGFNAQANGGIGTYNYQWTYGDGYITNSYQNTQTHQYNEGTFIASVKVTDANGNSATTSCGTINAIKPITPITGTCTITPKSGNTPLTTTLNAQITGGTGTYTYQWTYGDGTTQNSNQNSILHTYYTEGTYTTTLTVTDSNNNQLTICCGFINVTKPVTPISITCNANPTSGNAPLTVGFNAQANGGIGTYNYQWTYGDGNIINSYQNTQTHQYNEGTFNTNVKVTDTQGNSATTSCGTINAIKPITPITGTCTITPKSGNTPLTTTLNAQITGGTGTYTYQWTYGDGTTQNSNQNSILHTYYTEGTYTTTLTVTDSNNNQLTINCGCITATKPVTPISITCNANPTNGNAPLTVGFNAQANGGIGTYNYQWTYGDGNIINSYQNTQTHQYNSGTFNTNVKVTDTQGNSATTSCGTITSIKPITPITGTCTITPKSGNTPLTTTLNAQITGGTGTYTYQWTYGDGTTQNSNQNSITHTYYNEGIYTTTLTVTDSNNNQYTICCGAITATKPITPITGTCNADPKIGNAPLTTTLTAQAYGGTGIYNYQWTFGDGTIQNTNQNSITHTYYTEGTCNPKVTIMDSANNQITICCGFINVTKPITPISVTCSANPTNGNAPLTVGFNAQANGGTGTYTYQWTYGDGNTQNSNQNTQTHLYNSGTYTANVKVTDAQGNSATTSCGTINAIKPTVPITGTCTILPTSGNVPLQATISAQITGGTGIYNYQWTFGDGTTQNGYQNSITHTYTTVGTYSATLTVTDSNNNQATIICGCISATCTIKPVSVTCSANPTSGNAPLTTTLNAQATGGTGTYTYQWTYGDGNTIDGNYNSIAHTYTSIGTYNPVVTVTDSTGRSATANCGSVSANEDDRYTLIAEAGGPYNGYTNEVTTFDGSASSGSLGIVKYVWDFGDGSTSETTSATIQHVYKNVERYNVVLRVYDANNHVRSDTATATILDRTYYAPKTYEDLPDKGLFVKQLIVYGRYGEVIRSYDELTVQLTLENQWDRRLEDIRVTVSIPELGISARSSLFDLSVGQDRDMAIFLPLYNVAPGTYNVQISIDNDDNGEQVRRVKYREITVVRR